MSQRTLFLVLVFLVAKSHAADVSGGGGKSGELKSAPRISQPILASADDKAETWRKNIRVPKGFTTETWATEPMLGNPVAFTFDEQGRCFTSETNRYRTSVLDIRHYYWMIEDDLASRSVEDRIAYTKKDFPKDWQQLEKETEIIRLIEDTNGDGKADRSRVYADGFNTMLDGIAAGVLAHDGKLWFTNIPNLWLLEGTGPDGRAQKKTSLSFGWGVRYSYTGHDFHGLAMGPDGRLYFSIGDRGAHIVDKATGKVLIDLPDEGGVFRCEQDGSHLELVMRGLRNPQELAFDEFGNLFTADNDSDQGDRERFVYVVEGGDAGWRVGWQHHPIGKNYNPWLAEKMWEPRKKDTPPGILSPIMNIPDGPSGVTYYPGTGLPADYAGSFFVCGFKGSTAKSSINTWKVKPSGAGFEVAQEPREFIGTTQATDVEFGPDSRIYFSDWGAEGWESQGRGRIYRATHTAAYAEQKAQVEEVQRLLREGFAQRASEELVKLLAHADQRIRLRAQWELAERLATEIFERVSAMRNPGATKSLNKRPLSELILKTALEGIPGSGLRLSRIHAIWLQAQAFRLFAAKCLKANEETTHEFAVSEAAGKFIADPDPEIRAQWWRTIADPNLTWTEEAKKIATKSLNDPESRVRFFAAMALAHGGDRSSAPAITTMLRENADKDQYLRHAGVMALVRCADDAALAAAAKDASRSVRLAALLAYARLGKSEAGNFVRDEDTEIVSEAARLINDTPVSDAMAALAELLNSDGKGSHPAREQTLIRVLNANFRVGEAKHANALANFAAGAANSDAMRVEALTLLAQWAKPAPRDRVVGVYRPLPARDAAPAIEALKQSAAKVFATRSEKILIAAAGAAASLGAKDAAPQLLAVVQDGKLPAKSRLAALEALAKLEVPQLETALAAAGSDATATLKTAASKLIGARNPDTAADHLIAAWASASTAEKQDIAAALGGNKSAKAGKFLATIVSGLAKEPNETHLEILEAAAAHSDAKAALAAYEKALPANDPVAKYRPALAGGDAEVGEKLFQEHPVAACLRCHKVNATGGEAGPDLTDFAKTHDRAYILESIVAPNAKIAPGFQMVILTMKDGSVKAGALKSEEHGVLTLQNPGAPAETVKAADVAKRDNAPSGMLPNLGELLTQREIRDIVEYVASFK